MRNLNANLAIKIAEVTAIIIKIFVQYVKMKRNL